MVCCRCRLHVAQRVGRIDVEQLQREAVEFVVVHRRFGQNTHAGGEPLPRLGLEIGGDAGVLRPPDHGARLRFGNAVALPLLDQFEVAVPRIVDLDLRDLGTHPQRQCETLFERLAARGAATRTA